MNKLETNALRIAELMEYKKSADNRYFISPNSSWQEYVVFFKEIIDLFSSYNGLMPIVFECNAGISFGITIRPDDIMLHDYLRNKYWFDCNYKKEPKFIEAIQLACIKYLELKNDK